MIHNTSPTEAPTYAVQYACIYAPPHWYTADQIGLTLIEAIRLAHRTHQTTGRTSRVIDELTGRPTGHYYLGKHAPGTEVIPSRP